MANLKPEGYKNTADIWEFLFQMKERNRPVAAQVGGIDYIDDEAVWVLAFPDFPGIKGYVPSQETGVDTQLVTRYIGQDVMVLIKGLDRENNLLACSRKELVDQALQELPKQLNNGDIIPVTIKAIMLDENRHSKLVVDIGGGVLVDVPHSAAVYYLSKPLREQYTVGQTVQAMVTNLDPLLVSIRDARPSPWSIADFKRGQFISGAVYRVADAYVFIEPDLCPGILGIASIPLMGEVKRGGSVFCKVRHFSADDKKLHLYINDYRM